MVAASPHVGPSQTDCRRNTVGKSRLIYRIVLALFFVLLGTPLLLSQIINGTILGIVTDKTGAVLPGATITIRNLGTGLTRTSLTDERGRYLEAQLPIGLYEIEAGLSGFETQVRREVRLTVGSELLLNFSLDPGQLHIVVDVKGDAPIVQGTSTEVSALVDEQTLRALPLNARDIQQLAAIQPGVQANAYFNLGPGMVVSGSRPEHNRFLLNGIDTTFTNPTPLSVANIVMGIEAVQEFQLLNSDYSAAYGEKGGGVVNTVTKAGTNRFHGNLYEFLRNEVFDARNFFDSGDVPNFNRHQFGASLGGPLRPGKTFFFTNYERLRHRLNLSNLAIVPDARARQGYLPDPNEPGGEIFVGVAPQVVPYLQLIPEANGARRGDGTAEYFSNPLQRIDDQYWTLRVDHALSARNALSGVYTGDWSQEFTPTQNTNFADHRNYDRHIASLQNVHTFSPSFLNTTRLGLNKSWLFYRTDTLVPVDPSLYFVPDPFFAPTPNGQFGAITISGLTGLALSYAGMAVTPRWNDYLALSFTTDFNKTHGAHSVQFGASYKHLWDNTDVPTNLGRGTFAFLGLRSFLQGQPNNFAVYVPGTPFARDWRNGFWGFYLEDSIRARPNLTLNLGVRYEFVHGPAEANGWITNLRGGVLDGVPTVGEPYFKQPRNLIAPRFGINWDPFGDGKTSVRLGGGVFYDLINSWSYVVFTPGNAPIGRAVTLINPPFPHAVEAIPPSSLSDFFAVEFEPRNPTKYSYNLTVERQLGKQTSLTLAYVGSRSRHLARRGNENVYYPQTLPDGRFFWPASPQQRPNPNFRFINIARFDANSSYDSFQVALQRRLAEGLAFQLNYSFGKCLDDVSTLYSGIGGGTLRLTGSTLQYIRDRKSSYGRCSFNNEHSANLSAIYALPWRNLKGPKGWVVADWQLGAITTILSGFPFELGTGFNNSRQGEPGTGPDRPDWAAGCNEQSAILGRPEQYFNPNCFAVAPPGFLGNMGSRILSGPGLIMSDWALSKAVPVGEQRRLEFRAEVFNIPNHPNFAVPTFLNLFNPDRTRIGSAGRITQTVTTSRQMQFAVKFIF